MKKGNLLEGILFILVGIILLGAALLTDSVLDSLLIGFAAGAICSGTVMTCKYFYWNTSKNKKRYQEKIENEKDSNSKHPGNPGHNEKTKSTDNRSR